MRGPPGSLARSGLFRGSVASRSPRGRCKGFWVPGPDREPRVQGLALSIKTTVDASPHGRRGRRRKMTRLERAYPRRRTLWIPGHSTASDAGRNNQPTIGGPLLVIGARAGRNPAKPEPLVPGHWTMPCGHWPFRPRGGVLPVFRDSESMWREHDEQHIGRAAAVVHGVHCGTTPRFGAVSEARRRCAAGRSQDVETAGQLPARGTGCGTAGAVLRHIPCAAAFTGLWRRPMRERRRSRSRCSRPRPGYRACVRR